jgi:phospholipase/lecithinase/hemolysin
MKGAKMKTACQGFITLSVSTAIRIPIAAMVVAATTLLIAASPSAAHPLDRLFVFGDSTVDTGWYNFRPSGESKFDQFLSDYNLARPRNNPPTYGMGKPTSSPGPVSVEVLAHLIGTDVLPADQVILPQTLPLLAAASQNASQGSEATAQLPGGLRPRLTGTNYATGGARNHDANTPGIGLFPNAVPTETQISNYLDRHQADGRSLYVISSGGNDVSYAINFAQDPTTYLTGAADTLAAAIATLQERGARHIIVTNLPESFGTTEQRTLRHLYNTELMSDLTALGVSYAWADMDGVRGQIVADPAKFGIAHTTNAAGDRACTDPPANLGITSAWAYMCSLSSPVSQPVSASFAEQALFSDNEHWASGGHAILGSYYFCLAVRSWPHLFPHLRDGFFPIDIPHPPTACSTFHPIVVTAR